MLFSDKAESYEEHPCLSKIPTCGCGYGVGSSLLKSPFINPSVYWAFKILLS
jgi:hypothetical protein